MLVCSKERKVQVQENLNLLYAFKRQSSQEALPLIYYWKPIPGNLVGLRYYRTSLAPQVQQLCREMHSWSFKRSLLYYSMFAEMVHGAHRNSYKAFWENPTWLYLASGLCVGVKRLGLKSSRSQEALWTKSLGQPCSLSAYPTLQGYCTDIVGARGNSCVSGAFWRKGELKIQERWG